MEQHCPGWSRLRNYQRSAVEALADKKVGLFMAAGLGKTSCALAAAHERGMCPLLVLTRAIGRHAWVRDAEWVLERPCVELRGERSRGKGQHRDGSFTSLDLALKTSDVLVTNYEILPARHEELRKIGWRGLILDESHELMQGFAPAKTYEGTRKIKARRFELVKDVQRAVQGPTWVLTATPIRSHVRDLWAQFHLTRRSDFPIRADRNSLSLSRWQWLRYYCNAHRSEWGGLDTTGEAHLDELAEYIRKWYVVLDRAAVAHELPSVQRDLIEVEPKWSRKGVKLGGGIEEAIATAAAMKVDAVCELALQYLAANTKVVLVTSRRALAVSIGRALHAVATRELHGRWRDKLWLQSVTGETPLPERMRLCADFQAWLGPAALCATYDSVQTSMDLHQASGLIFAALPSTPYALQQMEGRVGRLGGVPATVHYLIALGTIDEKIRSVLLNRLNTVETVGVDTVRGGVTNVIRGAVNEEEVLAGLQEWLAELETRQ